MRSLTTVGLVSVALGLAMSVFRDELAAAGSIDVTGASVTIGQAPVAGSLTVDDAASLGIAPTLEAPDTQALEYFNYTTTGGDDHTSFVHEGLGGPKFRAQVGLTMPGGVYDYASFTVDRGVVVHFSGPATIRATNEIRIDGRIEMEGPGLLKLDCAGDVTMLGHDDPVATGLFALDVGGTISMGVGGVLDVSAEENAKVHFEAKGHDGALTIDCDKADPSLVTTIADTVIEISKDGSILIRADNGRIDLTNTVMKGAFAEVVNMQELFPEELDENGFPVNVNVTGGAFEGLVIRSHWDVRLTGTEVTGAEAALWSFQGRIFLADETSIVTRRNVQIVGEAVDVGEGCEIRTTGDEAGMSMVLAAGWNSPIGVRIGAGATVEDRSGGALVLSAARGVEVHGTVRGYADSTLFESAEGDVYIADDADVDSPNGTLRMWAAGAVVAEGGTATLTARDFDVRCVTGDLDLDVESVHATAGRFVAMSNGTVRLRGAFSAVGDVQVISLADSIDVEGANLATTDASVGPSGFVRLATYAETSIDASNATFTTGDSDAQSGDVLIQVESEGTEVAEGVMKVQRSQAKRMPDGIHLQLSGTMTFPKPAASEFAGSARVQVGGASHRVFLNGSKSKFDGERPGMSLRVTRTGKTRAKFVLDLKESIAKDPGTIEDVRFVRAGLRANGKFRRPKTK